MWIGHSSHSGHATNFQIEIARNVKNAAFPLFLPLLNVKAVNAVNLFLLFALQCLVSQVYIGRTHGGDIDYFHLKSAPIPPPLPPLLSPQKYTQVLKLLALIYLHAGTDPVGCCQVFCNELFSIKETFKQQQLVFISKNVKRRVKNR